jgi:hypothetical protein
MKREIRQVIATEITNIAGGKSELSVEAEVQTFNGNEKLSLVEADPQGINPKILLLDVAVSTYGPGTDVLGYQTVTFKKSISAGQYTDVTVNADGNSKTAKVTVIPS